LHIDGGSCVPDEHPSIIEKFDCVVDSGPAGSTKMGCAVPLSGPFHN
jgi:hypothetical protein